MALIVIDPGFFTTVQDDGRPGYREWGVPCGGAFDRGSAELANALLGNPPGCAVLEFTLVGGTYQADCSMPLALAGAPMEAKVLGPNDADRFLLLPSSFSLREGERLVLGRNLTGARTYLAVRGGWQTVRTLGSRSSEKRLRSGEVLPAAQGTIPTRRLGDPPWRSSTDEPFRIIAGPDGRSHPELDLAFWSVRRFRVGPQSSRMGLRLEGDPVTVTASSNRATLSRFALSHWRKPALSTGPRARPARSSFAASRPWSKMLEAGLLMRWIHNAQGVGAI
jgi:allophanate hydrolase subunit 2